MSCGRAARRRRPDCRGSLQSTLRRHTRPEGRRAAQAFAPARSKNVTSGTLLMASADCAGIWPYRNRLGLRRQSRSRLNPGRAQAWDHASEDTSGKPGEGAGQYRARIKDGHPALCPSNASDHGDS
jgi:hypothetical protein